MQPPDLLAGHKPFRAIGVGGPVSYLALSGQVREVAVLTSAGFRKVGPPVLWVKRVRTPPAGSATHHSLNTDREPMSLRSKPLRVLFTASERDLIRRELGIHFSQYPSLADGIFLRTWRAGPQKNQPKIPPGCAL